MVDLKNLENARRDLLSRLDAGKSQANRNRCGQFATPPGLASQVIDFARSLLPARVRLRFLEPGFGTGAFYSALLNATKSSQVVAAVGYELDPYYAEPAARLWNKSGLSLVIDDFTDADPPQTECDRFNLVACNPPYVRHHHLTQSKKRELQARVSEHFGLDMNGLGGLYAYFLVLSQRWMSQNGVGAWLIPSEFMDVNYGRMLKQFLLEHVTLHRIHRFDPNDIQFDDALVSSAVVVFRNSPPPKHHKVEFTFGGTLASPNSAAKVEAADLKHVLKWTTLPARASRRLDARRGATLADLFSIKRGLATGCNEFFVLKPDQVRQLRLPGKMLTPILPSPRYLETDEILAHEGGEAQLQRRLFLLDCDLPENEVKERYPSLWKYLETGMRAGVHERYLCRHRDPWYSQEQRPPAPFLCTYMGRATTRSNVPFRFILNHSSATAANVYLLLYPKPKLQSVLDAHPSLARKIWKALSSITGEMLKDEGRIYGGGLHKMEPRELSNVSADVVLRVLEDSSDFRLVSSNCKCNKRNAADFKWFLVDEHDSSIIPEPTC